MAGKAACVRAYVTQRQKWIFRKRTVGELGRDKLPAQCLETSKSSLLKGVEKIQRRQVVKAGKTDESRWRHRI